MFSCFVLSKTAGGDIVISLKFIFKLNSPIFDIPFLSTISGDVDSVSCIDNDHSSDCFCSILKSSGNLRPVYSRIKSVHQ